MTLDKLIVGLVSLGGIVFTYWFFLMKKEKTVSVADSVDIVVDGGYTPNTISISKGKMTKINFMRSDPSSCLEEVVISDFKIKKYLPLHKRVTVEITPQKAGEFVFSCGMNMFHGKVIVQ